MWIKKLKRKKVQFLLVGIMLCVTAAVFCSCICFNFQLSSYSKERFSEAYCPDAYVFTIKDINPDHHFQNKEVRQNINSVDVLKGKNVSIPIKHESTNISSITNMMCSLTNSRFSQYIQRTEGDLTSVQPGDGEVWIVKTLASSYNIHIGDTLTMNYDNPVELKVSCIFTATYAPSERLTIMANIVNDKTLEQFNSEGDAGILAVDLKDTSEECITKMSVTNPYALLTFDREALKAYITKISNVVAAVSAIAALIVFIAALFIIRFIINNDLRKEMRSIGIYKSLGYSYKMIMNIYMKAYLLVGTIAITIGVLLSLPVVYYLGSSTAQVLGSFKLTSTSAIVGIITAALLIFMLWRGAMIALKKVRMITPVEAIATGQSLGEQKLSKSVIKSAKSPLATQVNEIFKHKKTSFVTLAVLTVSMYLLMFFASSYYTCGDIYDNVNIWLACPKFNTIITGNVTDDVNETIQNDENIKSAVSGNCFYFPPVELVDYKGNSRNVDFFILSDLSSKVTGITMSKGYTPEKSDEIALSAMLLKKLDKKVGDYLTITMEDRQVDYLICGSFASMESFTILLNVDAMRVLDPNYNPGLCFVNLKDKAKFADFKQNVESAYGSVSVDQDWTALRSAVDAIENMLTSVMLVMLIVFVLFAVIAIVNVLALTIAGKRRQYGILKSMGFTTSYMMSQNLCYIFIMLVVSVGIAGILHALFSKAIFAAVVINALENSASLLSGLVLGTIALIILVTVILSLPIRKITPVSLMEE